jgi:hypothetical protein
MSVPKINADDFKRTPSSRNHTISNDSQEPRQTIQQRPRGERRRSTRSSVTFAVLFSFVREERVTG